MENNKNEFQIIVGGAAGEGSKRAGMIIAKLFSSYGFHVFIHEDYESVIKGGHNFSQISASLDGVNAIRKNVDFLLALNKDAIIKHKEKLKEGGLLIYDDNSIEAEDLGEIKTVKVSLSDIVSEAGGIDLMKNTALVSAFSKIIGMDLEKVKNVLLKELPVETEKNMKVAEIAFSRAEKLNEIKEGENFSCDLLSGNMAVALGAIDAGLESCFAYPMTPSTGIIIFLAKTEGIRTFQAENEIGAVNSAMGCAYTGRRTMVGTSGGGFALMTEGVSFSAEAEVPLYIALSQRMGPATGVPTYGAQGDLLFALYSGHGDMMRFVASPSDVDEAYYLSGKCLNIAWKYQMPSILLLDKELSEDTYEFKKEYKVEKEEIIIGEQSAEYNRYDGEDISPMLFPGGEAVVKVTGYEHDTKGVAIEDAKKIKEMHEKRLRKYERLREEVNNMEAVKTYYEGDIVVIFWGSNKGVVLEAVKDMNIKVVQPLILQPFPEKQMKEALEGAKKVICVETNATAQMAQLLRFFGVDVKEKILKYDGRPFTVEELREKIKGLL
jgi:2-oxoglutarate ferredoxin oxidoreductase subunit alpha